MPITHASWLSRVANYTCKLALMGGQLHMQAGPYGRPITHESWPLWEANYTCKLALMGGHLYMSAGPYGLLPGNLKFLRGHQFWPDIAHTSVIMGGGCTAFNMSVKHSTLTFTYAQTLIVLNTVLIVSGMYLK